MWRDISRRQWFRRLVGGLLGSAFAGRRATARATDSAPSPDSWAPDECPRCHRRSANQSGCTWYDGKSWQMAPSDRLRGSSHFCDPADALHRLVHRTTVICPPKEGTAGPAQACTTTIVSVPCVCPRCGGPYLVRSTTWMCGPVNAQPCYVYDGKR
jgi:hypothetical protein